MGFLQHIENTGIRLTDQQQSMVEHINGPILSLAVPGAGKTTSICIRIGNLIFNHGVLPSKILTMTFSKASAIDMQKRFDSLFKVKLKELDGKPIFSTIHSFAFNVIRNYYRFNHVLESKDSPESKYKLIRDIHNKINKSYISEAEYEEITMAISYVKNKMLQPELMTDKEIEDICSISNFKSIYQNYEESKRLKGYIDFDDMLSIAYKILKENKQALNHYRSQFDYFQLDEAQDTSKLQFSIIELLVFPKNNICFVADDDQAIYSWRGGEVSYLLNFKDKFPAGEIYFMEQNFRSTKNIIETSNQFISKNIFRYKKDMFTIKDKGTPLNIMYLENETDELNYILDKIRESNKYSDNAIIYRNNIYSLPLVDLLEKNNIPYFIKDQDNMFFNHWVIQDILAFIKLIDNPNDYESFMKIYYKTNLYLNKELVLNAKPDNDNPNFLSNLLTSSQIEDYKKANIIKFKSNLAYIKNRSKEGTVVRHIMELLNYNNYLERSADDMGYNYSNTLSIITILELITSECMFNEIPEKLETLKETIRLSGKNKYNDSVTLTTAHGSKGLEFKKVYVINLIEDIFPSKQAAIKESKGKNELMEEERRLCYVAMTRGKEYVDLISLRTKNGKEVNSSKFIRELESIKGIKSDGNNIFDIGDVITHKAFGLGEVIMIDEVGDSIRILFDKVGTKKLKYTLCNEKRLIRKVT